MNKAQILQCLCDLQDRVQALENQSLNTTTVQVENSFLASAGVTGDSNQPNQILNLAPTRQDGAWTVAGNVASYAGSPDRVEIDASTYMQQNQSGAFARINPELELVRNGTTVVAKSGSGYQRHATGHDSSSNDFSWIDPAPGANPSYTLRAQQGSVQNDVLNVDIGHASFVAVEKVNVIQSVNIS